MPRPRSRRSRAPLGILLLTLATTAAALLVRMDASSTRPHDTVEGLPAAPVSVPRIHVPAGLNPGACSFLPPAGHGAPRVFVDPGHGGPDPGAVGATSAGSVVQEKDVTLAVALDLTLELHRRGYGVVLARRTDQSVARLTTDQVQDGEMTTAAVHEDTVARIECANAAQAGLLISIHFNAFDDPSVGGTETFWGDSRPFSASSRRLADLVQAHVLARLHNAGWDVPDRGDNPDSLSGSPALTAEGEAYGHLLELGPAQAGYLDQPSGMPGVLTEPLFLTRPSEADVAVSRQGQAAMALGLADAVSAYFGGPAGAPSSPGSG